MCVCVCVCLCASLLCHHQNDSCIKTGSDESHFNVSLIVREKSHKTVSTDHTFQEKGEPKRYRTEVLPLTSLTALPLGQTGSPVQELAGALLSSPPRDSVGGYNTSSCSSNNSSNSNNGSCSDKNRCRQCGRIRHLPMLELAPNRR